MLFSQYHHTLLIWPHVVIFIPNTVSIHLSQVLEITVIDRTVSVVSWPRRLSSVSPNLLDFWCLQNSLGLLMWALLKIFLRLSVCPKYRFSPFQNLCFPINFVMFIKVLKLVPYSKQTKVWVTINITFYVFLIVLKTLLILLLKSVSEENNIYAEFAF